MSSSKPYLGFYGDDFTGSTDALDALYACGIDAVLCLEPTPDILSHFPGVQAVGIAGTSRTLSPLEMENILPPLFRWLSDLGPKVIHYKVCSTFDSSREVGSIGKALEIGRRIVGTKCVPVVVGSPRLGRFVAFANLFARAGSSPTVHRIDRHPVMSRHPVTPMLEADLRLHLAKQTDIQIDHVSLVDLDNGVLPDSSENAILFDTVNHQHLTTIGCWIDKLTEIRQLFCVGSSAVETALAPLMHATLHKNAVQADKKREHTKPIFVVSGSCSTVTARQIQTAARLGFEIISVSAQEMVESTPESQILKDITKSAVGYLLAGRSVIVYTSLGVSNINPTEKYGDGTANGVRIGRALGHIMIEVVSATKLDRVAVAGGDTSGAVTQMIGVTALQVAAPVAPGAPLCRCKLRTGRHIEIALKGGQMGPDDYFRMVRDVDT